MYEEVLFIEGPRLVQHIPILNKQAKNKEFLMQLDVSEDRRFCILNKFILKHGISNKSYELPGSGTPEIINITTRSNVGRAGVWVFRIDGENISSTRQITKGVNCTTPTHPINGTIEPYDFTQVGAIIQFHCNKSYAPTKWRIAECQLNGTWAPDPARLICTFKRSNDSQSIDGENISSTHPITKDVNCTTSTLPNNGTIEAYIQQLLHTCRGSDPVHCNKNYIPIKWRTAECQLNGTWAPDPAQLICTFKRRSHDSQLLVKYSVISAIAVVFIVGQGAGVIYISIILIKRRRKEEKNYCLKIRKNYI